MFLLIKIIILCEKQNIPLRGHREIIDNDDNNDGNFRNLIKLIIDNGQKELANHFESCPKNSLYTSPQIQNEIIEIIGEFIQNKIISKIASSDSFYSILADETQDITAIEQLSLAVRYLC